MKKENKNDKKQELFSAATLDLLKKAAKNPKNKITTKERKKAYISNSDLFGTAVKYTIKAEDETEIFSIEEFIFGDAKQYVLIINRKDCTDNFSDGQLSGLANAVKLANLDQKGKLGEKEEGIQQFLQEYTK